MSRTWDMLRQSELYADDPRLVKTSGESIETTAGLSVQAGPGAAVLVHDEPRGVLADRLRFLRAHLAGLWSEEKLKSILIASPSTHDGKSTVALNLAIILAEGGKRRVLLIEADMHHPTVTERLCLGNHTATGLSDCLAGEVDPFATILRVEPFGIFLLPAGNPGIHPTELLQSDTLRGLMQSLRARFDWVVVDSPPVQPLSDALLLRQRTDATLLVVRSGCTRGPAVDEAVALLGKKNILGVVLNGVEGLERAYSKYYGSYGGNGNGNK